MVTLLLESVADCVNALVDFFPCGFSGGNKRGGTADDGGGLPYHGSRHHTDLCSNVFRCDGARGESSLSLRWSCNGLAKERALVN